MTIVKHVKEGDVLVVVIEQERLVDDVTLQELSKDVVEALENTNEKHVVLDFGLVEFMSSAGLGMLIRIKKRCAQHGKALILCNFVPAVADVIRITGLDRLFEIQDDVAQAIASLQEG
jgi:anti-sigma B factor antagonist